MPGRGGLIGILGTGIGMGAEMNERRKQKTALSRENSEQNTTEQSTAGPSSQQQRGALTPSSTSDLPPAYDDVVPAGAGQPSRSLASGGPPMDDKKASLAQYDDEDDQADAPYYDDGLITFEEDDERVWDLDEAIARERGGESPDEDETDQPRGREEDLVREVLDTHRTTLAAAKEIGFETSPLPVPVILPQRRPRKKERGFVHAYAPLLGECAGISQATFLLFLKNFQKSSRASPIFPIIFVAAAIAGMAPSVIAMAVTTVVQIAAQTGAEIQSRQRTNNFLDKMNEELFRPAGLYAMIVKYKSDREVAQSGDNLLVRLGVSGQKANLTTSEIISKFDRSLSDESASRTMGQRMAGMRLASDTTKGSMAMPAAAPLIFPEIDAAVAVEGEQTFKEKAKDYHGFLADYMDKRAQVKYARDDPNSALNIPAEERAFNSKLADPNHPMYNGGIVGFVSGGYLTREDKRRPDGSFPSKADRRDDRRAYKDDRRMLRYEQRLDSGRDLSRKKERRYDDIRASRGYGSAYGDEEDRGYGRGGRRRRGGPLGLVARGIGAAVEAATKKDQPQEKSMEYEDSYDSRLAPTDRKEMRRSFDERDAGYGGPAPHAPYRGQSSSSYAPYGGQSSAPPVPYGGRQQSYNRSGRKQGGGVLGVVKKVMTEDVIYLMIVPMPSEQELTEARETLARAKANK